MANGLADEVISHSEVPLAGLVTPPEDSPRSYLRVVGYAPLKSFLDRLLTLLLLVPGLPLIGILICMVKLTSKGPGLYSQVRVGRFGQSFVLYKIRSMRSDAEAESGPTWAAVGNDPRVTRVGYWIRRLHLDELPQLFNVLRGEMSLVGPRPERPEFVVHLVDQIPRYNKRLDILPGITGLAQVNLPPDTDVDSVRRKLCLDLEYLETASVGLDLRILLCTIARVVGIGGKPLLTWLGLLRKVSLPVRSTPRTDESCLGPQALSSVLLSSVDGLHSNA
jgi:lipopolysaccharide/colanic/teichoic acid biosynthesis glycosyltransferase